MHDASILVALLSMHDVVVLIADHHQISPFASSLCNLIAHVPLDYGRSYLRDAALS
jgi:hypothetical protein